VRKRFLQATVQLRTNFKPALDHISPGAAPAPVIKKSYKFPSGREFRSRPVVVALKEYEHFL
jgi:hypothetical protein